MKMPTPNELMDKIGVKQQSVEYGDSRTILKYLDVPVVAYGLGFNGFVCIIKIKSNFLKGYAYGNRHPFSKYSDAGFNELSIDMVKEIIENNRLLVDKGFDKEVFSEGKVKPDYSTIRPVIATLDYRDRTMWDSKTNNWENWDTNSYRLVRLKSGKMRAEVLRNKWERYDLQSFIDNAKIKEGIMKEKHSYDNYESLIEIKNIKNNIPDEILQEVKDQLLIQDI